MAQEKAKEKQWLGMLAMQVFPGFVATPGRSLSRPELLFDFLVGGSALLCG
jgi:hypothetical protein